MARKMQPGECRKTKNDQPYCMDSKGQVRFKKKTGRLGGATSNRRSTSRRKSGTKGKTCVRYKRVSVKGTRAKQRRCAQFK